jgi:hypothetical protein
MDCGRERHNQVAVYNHMPRERSATRDALRHDPGGDRTHDLRIKSPLLYQLSYRVVLQRKLTDWPLLPSGHVCCPT